jgi:NAD-dependent dihydropyrimidine dehydrogenase PreA subunit
MNDTIALSRSYGCHEGGPVLHAVERRIFALRYFQNCMGCGFCRDACCAHGVDIDLDNVTRLKAMPADFKAAIGVPESEWFTGEIITDAEFPSGRHVRTRVRDGACVFLNRAERGCRIHAWCLEHGLDYHALKPLVSTLFPLTFEHGVLVASGELADGSLVCGGDGQTCYQGARGELEYYFGSPLVAELDGLEAAHSP